jgi:hypothetical protein
MQRIIAGRPRQPRRSKWVKTRGFWGFRRAIVWEQSAAKEKALPPEAPFAILDRDVRG